MEKQYSIKFKLDSIILALIYICYKYKFPASYMLSFYEMYGKQSLFILKAISCSKKVPLNDNTFIKIIEESKLLHKQILSGISTNIKIQNLTAQLKAGGKLKECIPEKPSLHLEEFSNDYKTFITDYLTQNMVELFTETPELKLNTSDLYCEMK